MKTVVALYDDIDDAWNAVNDLSEAGFDQRKISVVAHDVDNRFSRFLEEEGDVPHEVSTDKPDAPERRKTSEGAGWGAAVGGVVGALAGVGALLIPGGGPIVAVGAISAALAGAGIGAASGGLLGALAGMGISEEETGWYAEAIHRGGTVVAVNTTEGRAKEASNILADYNPIDIERRVEEWKQQGWQGFDEDGDLLDAEEREAVRTSADKAAERDRAVRTYEATRVSPPTQAGYTSSSVTQHSGHVKRDGDANSGTAAFGNEPTGESSQRSSPAAQMRTAGKGGPVASEVFSEHEPQFREHFRGQAGNAENFGEYRQAYLEGTELGTEYQSREWSEVEQEARRRWERNQHPQPWGKVKNLVKHGYDTVGRSAKS